MMQTDKNNLFREFFAEH